MWSDSWSNAADEDPADRTPLAHRGHGAFIPQAASGFERFASASDRQQRRLLQPFSADDRTLIVMAANGYWPREIAHAVHRPLAEVQAALTRVEITLRWRWRPERLRVVRREH